MATMVPAKWQFLDIAPLFFVADVIASAACYCDEFSVRDLDGCIIAFAPDIASKKPQPAA